MSWAFDRAHGHLPDINRFELPRDSSHPHRPAISSDTDPRGIIVARRVHTDQVRGIAALTEDTMVSGGFGDIRRVCI